MGNKTGKMKEETEKVSQIIPEEEMQRIKDVLIDGDIIKATERIKCALEKADNVPLNIAVTGDSGVGKSTFINVIRNVSDEDDGAAETGVVQATMEPTAYPHPRYKNVIFWDLPGIGTPKFNANKYLKKVKFHTYDVFIIMGSQRFTENLLFLAEAVRSKKKSCYLVRSKIDCDLEACRQRKPKTFNEEQTLQEMREDLIKGVRCQEIQKKHIFLISSINPKKYDFTTFQETLQEELPKHKRDMLVRCLPTISVQILEEKKKILKERIWQVSVLSSAIAVIPVPGLSFACDIAIIASSVQLILDDFGLTRANLEKLSKRNNKDVNEFISVIKSPFFNVEITMELIIKMLLSAAVGAVMVVEFVLSTIPIIGSLAAGGISFATTYCMLNNFLEEITADSQRVLAKALEAEV